MYLQEWWINLRSRRAVAAVVDSRRDAHHDRREEVTGHIVVLAAGELALEHLHQHEVQLHALQTHPGEGCQEAEVQDASDDGAHQLTGGGDKETSSSRISGDVSSVSI